MSASERRPAQFATTQWSVVLAAGDRAHVEAAQALAELCQRYWFPLYCYVRRRTADVHEAQDLTQAFFARLLEKDVLARAAPERGRFRSFLLTSLANFLANEHDRAGALKRGGRQCILSLDFDSGESRLHLEPAHEETPERLYQRQWALNLLQRSVDRLQAALAGEGKARQFELLKPVLTGSLPEEGYPAVAAELGISAEAARQAGTRLRKRYRQILRDEVAQTVADPADVDEEIRSLLAVLAGRG